MTSRLLLLTLEEFLRQAVAGYPFPSPGQGLADVRLFVHALPDNGPGEGPGGGPDDACATCYPFIVLRWLSGSVACAEDGGTVVTDTVALALGVYAPQSQTQAGMLLAELLDATRYALWRARLVGQRFELAEPLEAAIPEPHERWHLFHLATLKTTWTYTWPPRGKAELNTLEER